MPVEPSVAIDSRETVIMFGARQAIDGQEAMDRVYIVRWFRNVTGLSTVTQLMSLQLTIDEP